MGSRMFDKQRGAIVPREPQGPGVRPGLSRTGRPARGELHRGAGDKPGPVQRPAPRILIGPLGAPVGGGGNRPALQGVGSAAVALPGPSEEDGRVGVIDEAKRFGMPVRADTCRGGCCQHRRPTRAVPEEGVGSFVPQGVLQAVRPHELHRVPIQEIVAHQVVTRHGPGGPGQDHPGRFVHLGTQQRGGPSRSLRRLDGHPRGVGDKTGLGQLDHRDGADAQGDPPGSEQAGQGPRRGQHEEGVRGEEVAGPVLRSGIGEQIEDPPGHEQTAEPGREQPPSARRSRNGKQPQGHREEDPGHLQVPQKPVRVDAQTQQQIEGGPVRGVEGEGAPGSTGLPWSRRCRPGRRRPPPGPATRPPAGRGARGSARPRAGRWGRRPEAGGQGTPDPGDGREG